MHTTSLVLASASPARLATLRSAGIEPDVIVSGVDEDAVLDAARSRAVEGGTALEPADVALLLAQAKAQEVASAHALDALVLGCDSVLELGGVVHGKPGSPAQARERWLAMRGRTGVLHTGHWVIDERDELGTGATFGATASTTVHFAEPTDAEIDAYIATGEPLRVAGAFTVDGMGGAFVRGIEGDHHNVVGLSLPLLRELVAELDVPWHSLWRPV